MAVSLEETRGRYSLGISALPPQGAAADAAEVGEDVNSLSFRRVETVTDISELRRIAVRIRRELSVVPASPPCHSKALEIASRVLGAGGDWNESLRVARPSSLVEENRSPGLDVFSLDDGPLPFLLFLSAVLPRPDSWTPEAWNSRARAFWSAVYPSVRELAEIEERPVSPADLRLALSWDGVGLLRLDPRVSSEAKQTLAAWARPWHSAYCPPSNDYVDIVSAWTPVLDYLEDLRARPFCWISEIADGRLRVDRDSVLSSRMARLLCERLSASFLASKSASKALLSQFRHNV